MSDLVSKTIIGWKEYVVFPEWADLHVLAKSDSGAATSAIDVDTLEEISGNRIRFNVVTSRKHPDRHVTIEADIFRRTSVKSSNGQTHKRYVIRTKMQLGKRTNEIELSLVCRKNMKCRMLIGRQALSEHFLVDSSQTFMLGTAKDVKKRLRKSKSQ